MSSQTSSFTRIATILIGLGFGVIYMMPFASADADPPAPAPERCLQRQVFDLPGDALKNDNRAVGPFCCTGHTAVVRRIGDGVPLGYAHFFWWDGQAYNCDD